MPCLSGHPSAYALPDSSLRVDIRLPISLALRTLVGIPSDSQEDGSKFFGVIQSPGHAFPGEWFDVA